jgi:hypothetical protein
MTVSKRRSALGSLSACGLSLVLTGCTSTSTSFTPTAGLSLPPRPADCYLDIIDTGSPPFAYVVIGRVATDSTSGGLVALGETNERTVERMRKRACRAGAHGLLQVSSNTQGHFTDRSFSKSSSGGAVAFIYVDANGQALPPPTRATLIIHQGAAAGPSATVRVVTPPPEAPPVAVAPDPIQPTTQPSRQSARATAQPSSTEPAFAGGQP